MKTTRVASVSINQTSLDWDGNYNRIKAALIEVSKENPKIIVFPELCISGYGCEDAFLREETLTRSWDMLQELLLDYRTIFRDTSVVCCLGLPVMYNDAIYNSVAVIQDSKIVGIVPKQCLANEGVHYERRWFTPWESSRITKLAKRHHPEAPGIPFGDLIFSGYPIKFGFEICEDGWNYKRPGINLSERGVNIILNPSASHFSVGKHETRQQFILEGTRAFNCAYVYSNLMGCEPGRIIYDGGTVIANQNKILKQGKRFSFKDFDFITETVEVRSNQISKTQIINRSSQEYPFVSLRDLGTDEVPVLSAENSIIKSNKYDEISEAVALGLKDYLRKTKSKGFVVSLSGGADSSSVSLMVHIMVQILITTFNRTEFNEIFPQFKDDTFEYTDKGLTNHLLRCMYQSTENSSEHTRNMAKLLCDNTGADFKEIDVNDIFKKYKELLETAYGFEFSWEKHDISLQNLQARVRSPGIWAVANLTNSLLLTTSNRSEAAVGYASMDGDTSGGLAPIAGLSKTVVLEWLAHHKRTGFSWLEPICDQKPTAELRPEDQSDEEDLMPYEILNLIEEQAFLYKRGPRDILKILRKNYPQYETEGRLLLWVKKFFRLWSINQWKRERYAPAFHLDDRSLDPKTWCRFPILNGQFEKELSELS